jgi:hypothetical protein
LDRGTLRCEGFSIGPDGTVELTKGRSPGIFGSAPAYFSRTTEALVGTPESTLILLADGAALYGHGCVFHEQDAWPIVGGGELRVVGRRYLYPVEKGNDTALTFEFQGTRFELEPGGSREVGGLTVVVHHATDNESEMDRTITGPQHWFGLEVTCP